MPVASLSAPAEPDGAQRPVAARRMRRVGVWAGVLAALLLLLTGGAYVVATLSAPLPPAEPAAQAPAPVVAAAAVVDQPDFGSWAVGAVGFDEVLAAGNDSTALPIASIAKVVTALVVLQANPVPAGQQGPDITYTDADVAILADMVARGGSVAPVRAGETLTLTESLQAMLLPSGNNYADSLAVWAFGSLDAYVQRANAWAAENGLTSLRIADPSGLSPANTSTAADLVRLGRLALADATLSSVVATPRVDVPGLGLLENTNRLLGSHGVDGIKTGTGSGVANLLFSADVPVGSTSVTVVGVLLGGPDHDEVRQAVGAMIDTIAPGFHEVRAVEPGSVLARYTTAWGDSAVARAAEGASVVVWSDEPVGVTVDADAVAAAPDGRTDGDPVGTATVTAGDERVEVPLVLDGDLADPGPWWRLTSPGSLEAASPSWLDLAARVDALQ